jgi:hypothetical protein
MSSLDFKSPKDIISYANQVAYSRPTSAKKQALSKFFPLSAAFRKDPYAYMGNQSVYKLHIIDTLLYWQIRHGKVYATQTRIGEIVGIGREHCNRLIKELAEDGLITKIYRHMTSCLYKVSSFFLQQDVLSKMGKFLPTLKALSLVIVTLLNVGYTEYTRISLSHCNIARTTDTKWGKTKIISLRDFLESKKYNPHGYDPIFKAIKDVKLPLTKWGKISLTVFPEEAILYVTNQIMYFKDIDDPYSCFYQKCVDYCEGQGIELNWSLFKQLSIAYDMPKNAPMLLQAVEPLARRSAQTEKLKRIPQREVMIAKNTTTGAPGIVGITPTTLYKAVAPVKLTTDEKINEIDCIQATKTPDWLLPFRDRNCANIMERR